MKNKLQSILESVAPVKSKAGGIIDYRTLVGRTSNDFLKRLVNTDVETDAAQKTIKKAIAQKPSNELPTEEVTEQTVRRVLDNKVVKDRDEKTKRRQANRNSSLSASERSKVSRDAARTRAKDKSGVRDAVKKRERSNKKRDLLNLN